MRQHSAFSQGSCFLVVSKRTRPTSIIIEGSSAYKPFSAFWLMTDTRMLMARLLPS